MDVNFVLLAVLVFMGLVGFGVLVVFVLALLMDLPK